MLSVSFETIPIIFVFFVAVFTTIIGILFKFCLDSSKENIFRLFSWRIPNQIADFGVLIVKWVVYLALVLGPALFYFKADSRIDFVMRFAIIPFTVGMFSFMIEDREGFRKFRGIGFLYLASGALSMVAMTSSGFFPIAEVTASELLPYSIGYFFTALTNLLLFLVNYGSIFGFSILFGVGTWLALESTWSYGWNTMEDEINSYFEDLRQKLAFTKRLRD